MDISLIIVGTGKWHEYTLPFLNSIKEHEPNLKVVLVNNGNDRDYERMEGVSEVTTHEVVSYAKALNLGMSWAQQNFDPDWFIPVNNDVLVTKPFSHALRSYDPAFLYGFYTHLIVNQPYLSGWALLISRQCWNDVGNFDEHFKPMYYEDADYSIRARKAGYELVELDRKEFGLRHLEGERHQERSREIVKHRETRAKHREYLKKKHNFG
jgi:GT2 family glycosyltransferase